MKERDLLNAMNDIDDRYVEEAAGESVKVLKQSPKSKAKRIGIWAGSIAAGLVVVFLGTSLFTGRMGSAASFDSASTVTAAYAPESASMNYAKAEEAYDYEYSDEVYYENGWNDSVYEEETSSDYSIDTSSLEKKNVKLIYRASVCVQTTDFQQTVDSITALVNSCEGYFESMDVQRNGYYADDNDYYYGYYTVRIPTESYPDFINALGDNCHITNLSQSVEDIGTQYYETEARLETLRTKEERLHELLEQAAGLSDIIELESALSDTEYEIDQLSGTLKRYDSLVGYSTINIDVEKVSRVDTVIEQDNSFGARIERAFRRGASNFANGFENFVIWLSESIFALAFIAIIAVVICIVVKRIVKKHKAKKNQL